MAEKGYEPQMTQRERMNHGGEEKTEGQIP
jgi:hypothetical protein